MKSTLRLLVSRDLLESEHPTARRWPMSRYTHTHRTFSRVHTLSRSHGGSWGWWWVRLSESNTMTSGESSEELRESLNSFTPASALWMVAAQRVPFFCDAGSSPDEACTHAAREYGTVTLEMVCGGAECW